MSSPQDPEIDPSVGLQTTAREEQPLEETDLINRQKQIIKAFLK
jgi:hypothetical protein